MWPLPGSGRDELGDGGEAGAAVRLLPKECSFRER